MAGFKGTRYSMGIVLLMVGWHGSRASEPTIRAPDGFEVELYAGDDLAHDIYSMTIDAYGRVVVAGAGYIKILRDDDQDGQADRATTFSDVPAGGARGLCFDGPDLICTGDNALMRLRDRDGDGRADGAPEIWAELRNPEHGANGIVRGPDGWFYLICGNDAGVGPQHASTLRSPVTVPESGTILRFSPDGKDSEIVAHGFRNPYDLDFAATGALLAVDSDGERDQHLPWYSPTRMFDVAVGKHHGWVLQGWQRSWSRPPWYFDSAERVLEIGRGSPTGLAVYRHRQFPPAYRDGVFGCCWTLGRVYFFPLARSGASFASQSGMFLETTGQTGFAPVDVAIGPTGEMFVAVGGRRTQGSVFRVRYRGPTPVPVLNTDAVLEILAADQPLAAWSRAAWVPAATALGRDAFVRAAVNSSLAPRYRVRAVEILTELFGGLPEAMLAEFDDDRDGAVLARLAWSLGRQQPGETGLRRLAQLTWNRDSAVERAAWEALASLPPFVGRLDMANWLTMESHPERCVRYAALLADLRHRGDGRPIESPESSPAKILTFLWRLQLRGLLNNEHVDVAFRAFAASADAGQRLEAVRLIELALGDIETQADDPGALVGYSFRQSVRRRSLQPRGWEQELAAAFPSASHDLNRELARLCGLLRIADPDLRDRIAQQWTRSSTVPDDLHYLLVLSQLPGERSEHLSARTANSLVQLYRKMEEDNRFPSRNWPVRLAEVFERLVAADPRLASSVFRESEFGLPQHSLLVLHVPRENQVDGAKRLLQVIEETNADWTTDCVEVAGLLPLEESLPLLRSHWDDYRLRDAIVRVCARSPSLADRERFVASLGAAQPEIVELAAQAVAQLEMTPGSEELLTAMKALRRFAGSERYATVRKSLVQLICRWAGDEMLTEATQNEESLDDTQPLWQWYERNFPADAQRMRAFTGSAEWSARLERVAWDKGKAERGAAVFEKHACHRCHAGSGPLGPDLTGAAARMARSDLFAHVLDPNKEVSPLYQTSQVVTGSGRSVVGLIVYESPESTLVQTGPDATIRIAGEEIVSINKTNVSLMPTGLLAEATDEDLADLYAYLQTLRSKP